MYSSISWWNLTVNYLTFQWYFDIFSDNICMEMVGVFNGFSDGNEIIVRELVSEEETGGVVKRSSFLVLESGHDAPVSVVVGHDSSSLPVNYRLLNLNVIDSNIFDFDLGHFAWLRANYLDFSRLRHRFPA